MRIDELSLEQKKNLVNDIVAKKCGESDYDWSELVQEHNLDCSPDTLRKAGVGVKLAYEAAEWCADEESDIDRGFIDRQKLIDIQRGIRKDLREFSRTELICETIRESIKTLPKIELKNESTKEPMQQSQKELVIGMGDFHYGAEYVVTGLYGEILNEYNSSVFEKRMGMILNHVLQISEKEHPYQITIMIVGDLLEGILRASQLQRLEFGVVESAMRLSEFLCQWIGQISRATGIPIRVFAVRGNHGEIRPLGSKAGQFPEENLERVVMHYLFMRFLEEPMVIIENDDAPMVQTANVCGYEFLLIHGQGADIETIARDHQNLYGRPIDVFLCGHLHKSQTFTAGMTGKGSAVIERVPSLCGMDPYAQSRGFGSPPGATVIVMEEGYGRRCVYPITLT